MEKWVFHFFYLFSSHYRKSIAETALRSREVNFLSIPSVLCCINLKLSQYFCPIWLQVSLQSYPAIVRPNIPVAIPEPGFESPEAALFVCGVSSMTFQNISSDMVDNICMNVEFKWRDKYFRNNSFYVVYHQDVVVHARSVFIFCNMSNFATSIREKVAHAQTVMALFLTLRNNNA